MDRIVAAAVVFLFAAVALLHTRVLRNRGICLGNDDFFLFTGSVSEIVGIVVVLIFGFFLFFFMNVLRFALFFLGFVFFLFGGEFAYFVLDAYYFRFFVRRSILCCRSCFLSFGYCCLRFVHDGSGGFGRFVFNRFFFCRFRIFHGFFL